MTTDDVCVTGEPVWLKSIQPDGCISALSPLSVREVCSVVEDRHSCDGSPHSSLRLESAGVRDGTVPIHGEGKAEVVHAARTGLPPVRETG